MRLRFGNLYLFFFNHLAALASDFASKKERAALALRDDEAAQHNTKARV
jgi:hypothetical protein